MKSVRVYRWQRGGFDFVDWVIIAVAALLWLAGGVLAAFAVWLTFCGGATP